MKYHLLQGNIQKNKYLVTFLEVKNLTVSK